MKTWLALAWDYTRNSFWFVPALMAVAAAVLAVGLMLTDYHFRFEITETFTWLSGRDPEAVRNLLSALLGAIITALSIVFSVTIVALTLAVTQLGPRLLRSFRSDRGIQLALGVFVGTALYCLMVLWMVGQIDETAVPRLATLGAVVLAVVSLGVLIFFVHHISILVQAPHVVTSVSRELEAVIREYCPPRSEHNGEPDVDPPDTRPRTISSYRSSYVQGLEVESLMRLATERDLVIRVKQRPGRFVVKRQHLVDVWPADRVDDALAEKIVDAFVFGGRRTPTQDIEFSVDELVEVALRALSPSINDPFTAMTCIDRLGSALVELAHRRMPASRLLDDQGRLRVVLHQSDFAGVIDAAFNQIRQNAGRQPAVVLRLLETLAVVADFAQDEMHDQAIYRHAQMVHRLCESFSDPNDRADGDARLRKVVDALEKSRSSRRGNVKADPTPAVR